MHRQAQAVVVEAVGAFTASRYGTSGHSEPKTRL